MDGFDWSTNPILLKIVIHIRFTMMHVWKSWFKKNSIGSCKLMKLAIFWRIHLCARLCYSLKIDIHVRFVVMHVWSNWFLKKYYWYSCKFMQLAIFCKYICAHGFDWSTNPFLLEIDIHVRYTMMHVWNNWCSKNSIGNCKFMQHVSCLQIYLSARFWLIY